ncbi:MAG: hypothetical protein PF518_13640 [Spirochaetaceae bacterium]|jgi:hypothetical protein|nr:hypothetical protein [Spirochaetaceae bacterium]
MNKSHSVFVFLIHFFLLIALPVFSQDQSEQPSTGQPTDEAVTTEPETGTVKKITEKGQFHFFLNNVLIFPLSTYEGGFGLGETATVQYTFPFNLSLGLESGYYGFKSEAWTDGYPVVGGFSIIPILAQVSYNFRLIDGLYITPVLKAGIGFTTVNINGWLGDSAISSMFEGGVRLKAILAGGLLIQGNITYIGLIEKSGLFSIMTLGFGMGF